ncbi:PASTA domain-containing protein [Candidatus Neomicrothrix sp.]|uniref:PASTA domain-containing protein n=1 Tax=Candidatus Neomicrothrix sp. TaxID=2719034 RepID=UPI00259AD8FC|nr:PASTA domain-containing protein [Candidatus Microthrix sp.]HMS47022.1 PASTA domain-containing protein [Candidatus Microthrix sp.]
MSLLSTQPVDVEPEDGVANAEAAASAEPAAPGGAAEPGGVTDPAGVPDHTRVTEIGDYEVVEGGQRWTSLAVALIALVLLMWLAVDAFTQRLGIERDVVVPDIQVQDFSGQGLADAQREVEAGGLVAAIEFRANDLEEFPPGTIFTQRPLQGAKLPAGSRVTLVASSGPSQFVVPDVAGQELDEAQRLVSAIGLKPKAVPQYSDSVRVNEVIESRPRPGTEAAENSEVEIVVSAGYAPRKVPKMVGLPAEEALNLLGRSGLGAGDLDTQYRAGAEEGTVLEVSPNVGTVLSRNSAVNVMIAGPPPMVGVPSVEGLGRERAEGEVADAGLDARVLVLRVPLGSPDDGRVISQGVPPQTEVAPGFEIELIVGQAPPPPTTRPPPPTVLITVPPTAPPTTQPPPTEPPTTQPPPTEPPTTQPPPTPPPTTQPPPVTGTPPVPG